MSTIVGEVLPMLLIFINAVHSKLLILDLNTYYKYITNDKHTINKFH